MEEGNPATMMLTRKKQILNQAGYRYDFDRSLYFNREAMKAFSVEFIDDKPAEELARRIAEENSGKKWRFFFNNPPSETVKRELEKALQ
jgi:hypothetical protein